MDDLAPQPPPATTGLAPDRLRLSGQPDWIYLFREIYEIYRHMKSGGSEKIRGHQRTVREAISRMMKSDPDMHFRDPQSKPVTVHLTRALNEGRKERHGDLILALEAVRDRLDWQYGYEKVPRHLAPSYAYAELCGPSGPAITEEIILGLVLFGPSCVYPAHAHDGITESYVCLSGAVSENHQGVYAPGSMIFNPPEHTHRITVSDREPALLAYAWAGTREKLSHQKMVFSRPTMGRTKPATAD